MKSKTKKLSLKKVTILNFDEASRIMGGTEQEVCPFTTDATNCCGSQPGKDDSCNICLTYEPTCPETCLATQDAECMSY
jgi:hypothetical protein